MTRFGRWMLAAVSSLSLALPACGGSGGGGGATGDLGLGQIALTSIVPNPMQGCGPHDFVLNGVNFDPAVGTEAQVTFRAILPAGILPFGGGFSDHATVKGLVTSSTTIEGLTPPIVICGQSAITCEVDVLLKSGVFASSTGVFTVVFNAATITAILPNPIPAAMATPFTLTGTGFGPVGGPVTIRFTGDNGALLFKDGTKNFGEVFGTVVDANTITGITPITTVCGKLQEGANIQLFFPDGCCTLPTADGFAQFVAPTILTTSLNPVPAAVPQTGFIVNGTNFGPPNTVATVRFVADGGAHLFDDGTTDTIDVPGIVGLGSSTITLTTPLAAVCGTANMKAAIRVIAPFGSSCVQTPPGFLTFVAPSITGAPSVNPVPGAVATTLTIPGLNFGPTGLGVVVRFTSDSGDAIFDDGTATTKDVFGVITNPTTVTLKTPLVTICETASRTAQVRIFAPAGGACVDSVASFITFNAPTLSSISPNPASSFPLAGTQLFTLTGSGFGPTNSSCQVLFKGDGGEYLFGNGSTNEISMAGVIVNSTTITGTLPTATVCSGVRSASVRVVLQDGSCRTSGTAFLTFNGPAVTAPTTGAFTTVPGSVPTNLVISGTGFAPAGGVAFVTFSSDPSGPALFGDGTATDSAPIAGVIDASGTQITVKTPNATVLGATFRSASFRVSLSNGSCAFSQSAAVRFTAPSLTSFTLPAGGSFQAAIPTPFTISGTNFGPPNGEVLIRFVADLGATPFGNGTANVIEVPATINGAGTVITGTAPLAAVCPGTTQGVTLRALFADGSQSSNTLTGTYLAPVINTFAPATLGGAAVPFTITSTGTTFGPVNSLVEVTFTAVGGATPFTGGTQAQTSVTGQVVGAGTQVTGTTPIVSLCGLASVNIDVRVTFQGGACASKTSATAATPPTVAGGGLVPTSVDAVAPASITITGTNFPPVGTAVEVRFTSAANLFGSGTQTQASVVGVVNPANKITVTPPVGTVCGVVSIPATISLTFGNSACAATVTDSLTFVAPTITTVGTNLAAMSPGGSSVSGLNFGTLPIGTLVTLTLDAGAGNLIFADGSATQSTVVATVTGAGTISILSMPSATICGVATRSVGVRALFTGGSCALGAGTFIYNAPQVSAAPTGFLPQNLTYAASTPFTITGPGGLNQFGPAGATVQVRFSVASGTPFNGGTSSSAIVPGTIGGPTTVTGNAPNVVAIAATIPTVSVRVEFSDGSCTNAVTTSYFRTENRLAVAAPGALNLIDTATELSVAGSPFAVAGVAAGGGVTLDADLNRAYVTNNSAGGQVRILDLAGGTTAGTPTPTLLASVAPIVGPNPTGIVRDSVHNRLYVANSSAPTVSVIDQATNAVVKTIVLPGVSTGRIAFDATLSRVLVTRIAGFIDVIDTNSVSYAGSIGVTPPVGATWTGGIAVYPTLGKYFTTFLTAGVATDYVASFDAFTFSMTSVVLGVTPDPLADLAVDAVNNRLLIVSSTGSVFVRNAATLAASGLNLTPNAGSTAISANPSRNRAYVSNSTTDLVYVIDTAPANAAYVGAGISVTDPGLSFSTSP